MGPREISALREFFQLLDQWAEQEEQEQSRRLRPDQTGHLQGGQRATLSTRDATGTSGLTWVPECPERK